MSIDDRNSQKDVNEQCGDNDVKDLQQKKVTEPEAEQVKGGADFTITKQTDTSSPKLL